MLLCKSCGRKVPASEVKVRITEAGESSLICADCARDRGIM